MFTHPIMLAGLAGAMLPLIIHLLNRARYRTVDWGAMMFLDRASAPQQQVGRLRELILLSVRMLAVALLAIALARPAGRTLAGAAAEPGRASVVVIVDVSASMAHQDAGASRISAARFAVLRVLATLRRGDQVALIPAGATARQAAAFTGDLQSVAARVSELKPTAGSADFAQAISAAIDALQHQSDAGKRRIELVSDRQSIGWSGMDDVLAIDLKRRLTELGIQFTVIPVGSDESENISIESMQIINPPAVAGAEALLEVKLTNHGRHERLGVPLIVRLDERDERTLTLNLPPGQTVEAVIPLRPANAGAHVVDAEIRGDFGDVDDQRDAIIDVSPPISTLIVRGGDDLEGIDYLRAALAPYASTGRTGGDIAYVEIVPADDWDEESLDAYEVIILDDVATLSPAQAHALEQFVYAGGGLILAPGPSTHTNELNRLLFRDETALLPALLQPSVQPQQPLRIEPSTIDTSHPLLRFLAGHSGALPAVIDRFIPVTGRTPAARVLLSLSTGDPLIVESPFGAGRVVLFTAGLGARWSSLPLTDLYLPLVQSAIRYVRGVDATPRNFTAGQEVAVSFPATRPVAGRAAVYRPDGTRFDVDITDLEGRAEVHFADTSLPGVYTIRIGPRPGEQVARVAVAPAPHESDLSPLSEQRWNELSSQLGFERASAGRLRGAAAVDLAGQEPWLMLLAGVIALLVLEMVMTGAWSRVPALLRRRR